MMEISAEKLKLRLDNNEPLLIIDVREDWEYDEVNIGAQNIPLGQLPKNLEKLPADKQREIIIHCQSGRRSCQAQKYLTWQGFANVISLEGGIEAYLRLSNP